MYDSKNGKKITVKTHKEYGPYITVSNYEDGGALEDLLDEKYHVSYWKSTPSDFIDHGGNEYYFGNAADPVKLQLILDKINF
jgi:hypothetical protein